ncbi:MAG: hypothetical protein AB7G21_08065 [Dehalococcoidia bacterium]
MPDLHVFDTLTLEELEEASGELHRRIGIALRHIGEPRADEWDGEGVSPRRRVTGYAALIELASQTLGAITAGVPAPSARTDEHPALVAALMYATPTIPALLARLEQDRRQLASLARGRETMLDLEAATPWGTVTTRRVVVEASVAEAARCAMALERFLAALDAAESGGGPSLGLV